MGTIVFAALLIIGQTQTPMPRKPLPNHRQEEESQKKDATPPQPVSGLAPEKAYNGGDTGQAKADSSKTPNVPVAVAPVQINRKDTWDYLYIAASLLIAVATLIVAGLAATQARAAKQSAKVLISSERSWLMVSIRPALPAPFHIIEVVENGVPKAAVYVSFVCRNAGKAIAWITERRIWFRMDEFLPDKPDTSGPESFVQVGPEPLEPGGEIIRDIDISGEVDLRSGLGKTIYGFVKYRDVFASERRTWFGYALVASRSGNRLDRLVGYPEYNKDE